jgi:hypothetical protein
VMADIEEDSFHLSAATLGHCQAYCVQ